MYLLREVILLVVYGTITDGDDYDEIAEGGEAHLDFLRGMSEFHYGIPREDWLRVIVNRVDPTLFRPVSKPGSIRALLALLLRPSGRGDLTEKWLARRGSQGSVPQEPLLCTPTAPPLPAARIVHRYTLASKALKSRKREICASGTVRDEDGNVLIFSANERRDRGNVGIIRSPLRASILSDSFRRHRNSGC
jgi:DDE_Tnp_1-associated